MKKVVLKIECHDDKLKQKVMKVVSGLNGVESIAMDMNDKKLTVIGDVDPITIVVKLRKICHTEIISVGPAKEPEKKKKDGKKEEPKKEEGKKEEGKKEDGKKKDEAVKGAVPQAPPGYFVPPPQIYPGYNYQQQHAYSYQQPPMELQYYGLEPWALYMFRALNFISHIYPISHISLIFVYNHHKYIHTHTSFFVVIITLSKLLASNSQILSSSASDPSGATDYDICLSFHDDTRYKFTSHLYSALDRCGLKTFMNLDKQTVHDSKIHVVVFSKKYASSPPCLDQLVEIMNYHKSKQTRVIPIFYNIETSAALQNVTSISEKDFRSRDDKTPLDADRLANWRAALMDVRKMSGYRASSKRNICSNDNNFC